MAILTILSCEHETKRVSIFPFSLFFFSKEFYKKNRFECIRRPGVLDSFSRTKNSKLAAAGKDNAENSISQQHSSTVLGVRGSNSLSLYVKSKYSQDINKYLPHDPVLNNNIEEIALIGKTMKLDTISSTKLRKAASRVSFGRKFRTLVFAAKDQVTNQFTERIGGIPRPTEGKNMTGTAVHQRSNFLTIPKEAEGPFAILSKNYNVLNANIEETAYFSVEVENRGTVALQFSWKHHQIHQNIAAEANDDEIVEDEEENEEEVENFDPESENPTSTPAAVVVEPETPDSASSGKKKAKMERQENLKKQFLEKTQIERSDDKFFPPVEREGVLLPKNKKKFVFGFRSSKEGVLLHSFPENYLKFF